MKQPDLFIAGERAPGLVLPNETLVTMPDYTAWSLLQERAYTQVENAIYQGPAKRIVLTAPTGFGKTRLAQMIVERLCQKNGWNWIMYQHRRSLMEQTRKSFEDRGIHVGCRASGYAYYEDLTAAGQLAMFQSEKAAIESGKRPMHDAQIVLVDECHANKVGWSEELIRRHSDAGAIGLGLSATPLGLGHLYERLEILCTNSELRKAGGILMADVFCPFEVDVTDVEITETGEFNQKQLGQKFAVQQVVGGVYDWWVKLNPLQLPTLLFSPGIRESYYFVDEFIKRGVVAAHIDGEDVYLGERDEEGEPIVYRSNKQMRETVRRKSESGEIKVVCNRFVMREGVDWPHLYHGILATAFGTEEGYVQAVGRILRAYPKYQRVLITDHGGNVWRPGLGSPNADREWLLEDSNKSRAQKAKAALESGEEKPALNCPNCHRPVNWKHWAANGNKCPWCAKQFKRSTRWVQQTSGQLMKLTGDAVKIKRKSTEAQKAWDSMYFPSFKSNKPVSSSFTQLMNRFHKENPSFRVVLDKRKDITLVRHRETGETHVLGNCPSPSASCWDWQVRRVSRADLQRKVITTNGNQQEQAANAGHSDGFGGGCDSGVRGERREPADLSGWPAEPAGGGADSELREFLTDFTSESVDLP
jgi:superfamily II DNA or RNA helicase